MKLKLLYLPLILCALASAQDAKLRGGNILSAETYSFRQLIHDGKLDMLTVPAFYKEQGIKGISYNDMFFKRFDNAYIDEVKAAVQKAGRVVTCYVIEGNLATANDAKRNAQIQEDKQKIEVAKRLGAPLVRINLGNTGKENADETLGTDRAIAALKELLPVAEKLNVKISLENHGGPTKTAVNIVKIIKATDPKWIGSLVDFGNFPDANRYEEIATVAPYAFSTHVKINAFDANGEAAGVDFPRILKIMKKNHFKGAISIEYEAGGDPVEGVQKSKALIVKYW